MIKNPEPQFVGPFSQPGYENLTVSLYMSHMETKFLIIIMRYCILAVIIRSFRFIGWLATYDDNFPEGPKSPGPRPTHLKEFRSILVMAFYIQHPSLTPDSRNRTKPPWPTRNTRIYRQVYPQRDEHFNSLFYIFLFLFSATEFHLFAIFTLSYITRPWILWRPPPLPILSFFPFHISRI